MASLSFTLATVTPSCSPFFSQNTVQQRRLKKRLHMKQSHRFQVSCNNVSSDDHEKPLLPTSPQPHEKLILPQTSLDRRNLLLGLGGLYSTVSLTGPPSAFANPIASPSFLKDFAEPSCKEAGSGFNPKNLVRSSACCPPASKNGPERDYLLPETVVKPRIRKPIHSSPEDVKKYMDAIEKMRALPDDDPRSFKNQAKIHCAYCNGSYMQSGQELQIHNSWLFFPFHRWYLFFFERILGDLLGDSTFALPYWNWDNPEGMVIPDSFVNLKQSNSDQPNALYDLYRDPKHIRSSAQVDLDYAGKDRVDRIDQLTEINLTTINRQMIRNAFDAKSFFGGKYVAGNEPISNADNAVGSIEAGCHTAIHRWVGHPRYADTPNGEDMANFYSAGYDPLFYVHHANVDRMWTLWKKMGGEEPKDPDWGNASYVFYDEKQNPVRVYNKDSANLDKLGYQYAKSDTPWTLKPPRTRCRRPGFPKKPLTTDYDDDYPRCPISLSKTRSFIVYRPHDGIKRQAEEMKREKEVLCINGINFDGMQPVKFDVYVMACDVGEITPCDSENVGSFAAIPHAKGMTMGCKSGIMFSLSEMLEETDYDDEKSVVVTIVPQKGDGKDVTIEGVEIRLIPSLNIESKLLNA